MARGRPKGARGSELLRVLKKKEADAALATEAATAAAEQGVPKTSRMPCPGLWKTPVIRWDGELMACCADVDGEIAVGNLRDGDFDELWFGAQMTEYRMLHIEGRFAEIPKCWSCGGINFYKMDAAEIRSYLQDYNRMDLWPTYTQRMGFDLEGKPLES